MIYLPIFAAIAAATGLTLEKTVLNRKKIGVKLFQVASFFAIVLVMAPFAKFFWNVRPEAFSVKNILILSLIVLFSIIANILSIYAIKGSKINKTEPARILEPLFVVLLVVIFSFFIDSGIYSRDLKIVIPAIIAASALIFSHIKKDRLYFNKYFIAAIVASFFFALELVLSRLILNYYSPATFYITRSFFIFLISFILFRPDFSKLDKNSSFLILISGAIWAVYRTLLYHGFLKLGVIFTTLIIMLSPVFVYVFAKIFLKEKLTWRNIVSAIVIVLCVLYVLIFN